MRTTNLSSAGFCFDKDQFNRLFPFYILIGEDLRILDYGKSIEKLCPDAVGQFFEDRFIFHKPAMQQPAFAELKGLGDALVEVIGRRSDVILRGHFEHLPESKQLLLVGSPWFNSMDEVASKNLSLQDFAYHDPLVDLLHVLKAHEIMTDELKQLLSMVNHQKKELQAAHRKVEDLAEFPKQSPDPVYRISYEGDLLMLNPAGEELTPILFENVEYTVAGFFRMIASRISPARDHWSFEAEADGRRFSFHCKLIAEKRHFNIYGRDITVQKQNEAQLKRLALVARANSKGIMLLNEQEQVEWVNRSYEKITGYRLEDFKGKPPIPFIFGNQTDPEIVGRMQDLAARKIGFSEEFIHGRKDGSSFWSKTEMQFVSGKDGSTRQFIVVEDISERKAAEERLRQSELRWKFALEGSGDGVWDYNIQTGQVYFSAQYKKMLGYEEHEFLDTREEWYRHLHYDDRPVVNTVHAAYESQEIDRHSREYRIRNAQGEYIWILDRGIVMSRTEDGRPERIIGTQTNITERKLAERALQIREEKYRNIIANMNLGLVEVDNNEIIQFANQRFCNMSGYEVHEIIGRNALDLLVSGDNRKLVASKRAERRKGHSDAYEVAVRNKRGEQRWWLVSGAPHYNDEGELVGSIGIHLDVTEQKDLELKLYEAREQAELSAKAKERFLANMSHEIRTPMNAILGMSRQLEKTWLNDQQSLYLNTISTAAEHLLVIINDILDISKIEAGKLEIERIGFRLHDLLKHAQHVMQHRADEKGLALYFHFDELIAPVLLGDPFRLNQILLNLLSNAIRFTEKGSVRVDCRRVRTAKAGECISIVVSDTGIGMDREFLKNLFDKFTQEDTNTARKFGGTGLGMAITRQLVELMEGTIDVRSRKGKGTEVRLLIPFSVGSEIDLKPEETEAVDASRLVDKHILLVEDNEMNRLLALTILKPYQVRISQAHNGEEAVRMVREQEFDLVLMDVQMPVKNGLEATREIRNDLKSQVPIIALTANAIRGESDNCIAAGMNAFVSKPFEEHDLIHAMVASLDKGGGDPEAPRPAAPAPVADERPLFSLRKLIDISKGNQAFVEKMLAMFSQQVPAAAAEITRAFEQGDLKTVAALAHKIKPILDSLEIHSLHKPIRELEQAQAPKPDAAPLPGLVELVAEVIGTVNGQLQELAVTDLM